MKRITIIYILLILFIITFIGFFQSAFQSYNQFNQTSNLKVSSSSHKSKKVIFIIVDALRYDYHTKFSFIKDKLKSNPKGTYLSKCIAGNPTMTTQRIQSLMTGSQIYSPQTIIQSFFSQQVKLDNVISQLNLNNKTSLILGDNTWSILFNFSKQYICQTTFDIQDFQTCDNIIYDNLAQNCKKFDFIVAHFLALDHIGHATSSITNPKIQIKINLMTTYLTYLIDNLSDDTIFIMTGDHGMRTDGNHGGLSDDQAETFLFAYSKQPFLQIPDDNRSVKQSDITTTLAILMGIPIPKNSIGVPIFQILSQTYQLNDIQSMQQNIIDNQYIPLLQLSKIPCKIASIKNILPQQKIYSINQECLSSLSRAKPSIFFTLLFLILLTVIGLVLALLGKMTLGDHAIWFFTLLIVQFSWYLIRNNSTCLFFFIAVISIASKMIKLINKLAIIGIILILSQLEFDKIDQYQNSIFRVNILQKMIKSAQFQVLFLSYVFLTYFKQNKLKNKWINIFILFLTYLNIMLEYMKHSPLYLLRIFMIVFIIGWIVWISYGFQKQQNQNYKFQTLIFGLENIGCLFLGLDGPIIILCIKGVCKLVRKSQYRIQLVFLIGQFVWWILGNKYQYSSIDIKKSYVFNERFNEILNPLCLFLYLMFPYFLSIGQFLLYKQQNDQKNRFIKIIDEKQEQKQNVLKNQINEYMKGSIKIRQYQDYQLFKYLSIIMGSLISCCINLLINNQQILFTVVYVPLIVLTALRTIILIITIIIVHYYTNHFILNQNK